jgi:hypothetical protein
MELFYLLSIGMSIVALLPIVLNEPQLFPNQQNQTTGEAIIMAGVESTFSSESYLFSKNSIQVQAQEHLLGMAYDLEMKGTQRSTKTIVLPKDQNQHLKSAV